MRANFVRRGKNRSNAPDALNVGRYRNRKAREGDHVYVKHNAADLYLNQPSDANKFINVNQAVRSWLSDIRDLDKSIRYEVVDSYGEEVEIKISNKKVLIMYDFQITFRPDTSTVGY